MPEDELDELIVLRCVTCGDTFAVHGVDAASCPSCGGTEHQIANEPLL